MLNHGKYRDMMNAEERREYQRLKQAEYRKRKRDVVRAAQIEGATEAVADALEELK